MSKLKAMMFLSVFFVGLIGLQGCSSMTGDDGMMKDDMKSEEMKDDDMMEDDDEM
ncbi:hypothetical protein [Saccharospirillum salsuginis]|uniref:Uncharacterized protein n=1 Tax=Saccharospirillum salsuginis TaxID=418750 RepID=A0A918K8R9_9GAMM|nr:hypothetical protein [Saccharospirillum salsuginis]GGX54857.1 hypothetical protein GCM10007392_22920 [Saccharospirillum salsuginis]